MLVPAIVAKVVSRKPLPLTTVELQKSGSRLLKLSPKKILDVGSRLALRSAQPDYYDERSPSISISRDSFLIQGQRRISMTHNLISSR